MQNLPAKLKTDLLRELDWSLPEMIDQQTSEDRTTKILLLTKDGLKFETVIIRHPKRVTLCLSSEVGCKYGCAFCQTGKLGFFRSLHAHEMLSQIFVAQVLLQKENLSMTHLVFMGMGEPFANFDNLIKVLYRITDKDVLAISPKKITVSTVGLPEKIVLFGQLKLAKLAISIHAGNDQLRDKLLPINQRYPLSLLKSALTKYQKLTQDLITLEVILLKGVNDSLSEAKDLVRFIHGLRVKVNLIPFNPHPGISFQTPEQTSIDSFQEYLKNRSIAAPVRYGRGREISGACGQLAGKGRENLDQKPTRQSISRATP